MDDARASSPHAGTLLVVEDEENIAIGLKLNLELEGYRVEVAASGREGRTLLERAERAGEGPDAIVLDVMLPDIDGFALCQSLRDAGNYVPVLMLTARNAAEDRVRGLEAGADDYMAKPFELPELLARVRSMLRRRAWERDRETTRARGDVTPPASSLVTLGEASFDFEAHEVTVRGVSVKLTRLELDLVRYFIDHPNKVVSRQELLEDVWKLRNYSTARTVDNFVSRLRRHFESDPTNPRYFVSVRGAGYKFVP